MTTNLSHAHQTTYDAILGHPTPHNLHWRDVRSMLGALCEVADEANGKIKITRNGQMLILHPESHKDAGTDEQIGKLRHFLERSNEGVPASSHAGVNLLVHIDHREARIYKTEHRDSVPERIVPYDPSNSGRYLHNVSNDANGQRRPEVKSFYESVAKSLHGADAILLLGGGTGASSAMEQLLSELKLHHKDIAAKVVGSATVDDHHLSEEQLLAKARDFYTTRSKVSTL